MAHFGCRIQPGERLRRPSGRGNAGQPSPIGWGKDDGSVFSPGSAAIGAYIAKGGRRTAMGRDFLELAGGEVSDPFAVRGEERIVSALGARKRRGPQLIELPHIQALLSARIFDSENNSRSVGGEEHRGTIARPQRSLSAEFGAQPDGNICARSARVRPRAPEADHSEESARGCYRPRSAAADAPPD